VIPLVPVLASVMLSAVIATALRADELTVNTALAAKLRLPLVPLGALLIVTVLKVELPRSRTWLPVMLSVPPLLMFMAKGLLLPLVVECSGSTTTEIERRAACGDGDTSAAALNNTEVIEGRWASR